MARINALIGSTIPVDDPAGERVGHDRQIAHGAAGKILSPLLRSAAAFASELSTKVWILN
ncbi:hypothetical protein [Variovorax sp. PBL-E5]|uniref:hypothetical protein n=1 Tax=Variovorax sp. PBL-E5 TaxID=434014 RepID=UPI0013A56357|nr:hypothetical protein [Variovorax sp. PBL-E5]